MRQDTIFNPDAHVLWEVIAASTDTCEPRKYPDAERRRDTYAAHKYPEMRQLLPISALIVPLVH